MRTKIVLLLACLTVGVNAISSYSPYKIYQPTDTLTHVNLDSNLLRGPNWSSQLVDTLDKKFIRFTDVKDSTFQRINGDTLYSKKGTFTGPVTSATLNTGYGDFELGQSNRTTDDMQFGSVQTDFINVYNYTAHGYNLLIRKDDYITPGLSSGYYPRIQTDNDSLIFAISDKFTACLSRATADSGGSFVLHNNVDGDLVLNSKGTSSIPKNLNIGGGIQFDSGDLMTVYDEGSFPCTTSGLATEQTGTVRYVKSGKIIVLSFGSFTGTSDSAGFKLRFGSSVDTYGLRPSTGIPGVLVMGYTSSAVVCLATISYDTDKDYVEIEVGGQSSSWPSTGVKQTYSFNLVYSQ